MTQDHKLQVEAICNGSVIDHIPAGLGIKILNLFNLTHTHARITIGLNLPSKLQGAKDLIKVEDTLISDEQVNQLALIAPHATVNQIRDFNVVTKRSLALPEKVIGVFACPNSNCISHGEPVDSHFSVKGQEEDIQLKCHYCEKEFAQAVFTSQI